MVSTGRRFFFHRRTFREAIQGWLFILPAVLGLLVFNLGPVVASLLLSLTRYDIVSPPVFVGAENYVNLFTRDPTYAQSVAVTLKYVVMAVPLSVVVAYIIALLMNQGVRGISIYRTLWYLPALVPSIVTGALWGWFLNKDFGPINYPLKVLGLPTPGWLIDPDWVVPSLVLTHVWGLGNSVLIFLAGLQHVPQHLYEAAEVDGASRWHKLWYVTVPMTSSIIFFNLVMNIISSFQVFSIVYVIFRRYDGDYAGPSNSGLMYVLYLYWNAFRYFKNGYACALAWVLFLVIVGLTYLAFRTQKAWVYYETEAEGE
jgi:multiple sugar transport system permease protein